MARPGFSIGFGGAAPAFHSLVKRRVRAVGLVEEGLEVVEAVKGLFLDGLEDRDVETWLYGGPNFGEGQRLACVCDSTKLAEERRQLLFGCTAKVQRLKMASELLALEELFTIKSLR